MLYCDILLDDEAHFSAYLDACSGCLKRVQQQHSVRQPAECCLGGTAVPRRDGVVNFFLGLVSAKGSCRFFYCLCLVNFKSNSCWRLLHRTRLGTPGTVNLTCDQKEWSLD
jgi:hypothetical protein